MLVQWEVVRWEVVRWGVVRWEGARLGGMHSGETHLGKTRPLRRSVSSGTAVPAVMVAEMMIRRVERMVGDVEGTEEEAVADLGEEASDLEEAEVEEGEEEAVAEEEPEEEVAAVVVDVGMAGIQPKGILGRKKQE